MNIPGHQPGESGKPAAETRKLRTALVGCGAISPLHLVGVSALDAVELVALADPDRQAAENLAREAVKLTGQPAPAIYASLTDLLKEQVIDVVHILTPHFTHVDLTIEALEAGCHVLMEKPPAIDLASLHRLQQAAVSAPGQLGLNLQNRYNFASQQARQLLDAGTFGPIIATRAFVTWWREPEYYTGSPWRGRWATEGGCLMINQAIHTLDLMLWLVGDPASISGKITNEHLKGVIEIEDTAMAHIQFKNGATGVFYGTTAYPVSAEPLLEIACEKAILRLEGCDRLTVLDKTGYPLDGFTQIVKTEEDPAAKAAAAFVPAEKSYWGLSHAILIADYYRHIRENQRFAIDAVEGGRALTALLKLYQSSQTGERQEF